MLPAKPETANAFRSAPPTGYKKTENKNNNNIIIYKNKEKAHTKKTSDRKKFAVP